MGGEMFEAVKTILVGAVPAHVSIHDTDASAVSSDGANYPFLVLSGGVPREFGAAAGWCRDEASALVRVTHTALSPRAVRNLLAATRGVLVDARPVVAGWHGFELAIEDSSGIDVDRDVKILSDNAPAHPFYAVDIYRVRATR